jgi:hypothetical protein
MVEKGTFYSTMAKLVKFEVDPFIAMVAQIKATSDGK